MKRCIALLCLILLILSCAVPALASNFYMIPDSNTRRLTREELWTWQYDALGYIFNEIFARHGYHFEPGGRYDNYFRAQTWYRENPIYDNQGIYANLMTNIEWANERLCKEVRAEMRALGTTNEGGKVLPAVAFEPEIYGAFSQFQKVHFAPNQKLPVFSGPGTHYHRSANGKALASTNGNVYVGGWENGWLMIMYWTNDYNVRVGFTKSSSFKDKIDVPHLRFEYAPATIARRVQLTDDPVASFQPMATLEAGTKVTYLSEFFNERHWAYVEVTVSGVQMRGFVEASAVSLLSMEMDEPSFAPASVVEEAKAAAAPPAAAPPAANTSGFTEHWLWGLSSASTRQDIIDALNEKQIRFEQFEYGIDSDNRQSTVMFGVPVALGISVTQVVPETLSCFHIMNYDTWKPRSADPQSDADLRKALDAYQAFLEGVAAQYGAPTGGSMQTGEEAGGSWWSYPAKDGQLDYDTVLSALEKEGTVAVHTYHSNIEVSLHLSTLAANPYANVGIWFYSTGHEYMPPVADLLTFDQPKGGYTTGPRTIVIGF